MSRRTARSGSFAADAMEDAGAARPATLVGVVWAMAGALNVAVPDRTMDVANARIIAESPSPGWTVGHYRRLSRCSGEGMAVARQFPVMRRRVGGSTRALKKIAQNGSRGRDSGQRGNLLTS
jgi:hypothetical protein